MVNDLKGMLKMKSLNDAYKDSVERGIDFNNQTPSSIEEYEYLSIEAVRCGYTGDPKNTDGYNLFITLKDNYHNK